MRKHTKILVTGGAGYIGSHVCKLLAACGWEPVAYDNLSRGHSRAVRWGPLEHGDLADGARLRDVLARHQPVAVMHLAGYINVAESCADPGQGERQAYHVGRLGAEMEQRDATRRGADDGDGGVEDRAQVLVFAKRNGDECDPDQDQNAPEQRDDCHPDPGLCPTLGAPPCAHRQWRVP